MSIPAPSDVANPPSDAQKTASGLQYKLLSSGDGETTPLETSKVTVHYTGWMTNGTMFDSSVLRGEPTSFPLDRVIPGWTEGLQLMRSGDKMRFWIPGNLAYGETPPRPGMPFGTLVFDVELLSFVNPPPPPKVPEDLKNPPEDAQTTASGLTYRLLNRTIQDGDQPTASSTVTVHYTGWMVQDGKMFDSSVVRGETISFPLNRVIPGWTEGLQLMRVGDKMRFWIPGNLAYGETPPRPGMPFGTLVFDVELFSFT